MTPSVVIALIGVLVTGTGLTVGGVWKLTRTIGALTERLAVAEESIKNLKATDRQILSLLREKVKL